MAIWQWSAVQTATAIRTGQASAVEVMAAHQARLHAANPAVNAVVVDLSAAAMQQAEAADAARARGDTLGPLHGVPVTVKINVDVQGQANSNGVVAFKDVIAPADAPVVANLKKAGAILLGLTNTPEFSMRGFTDNPLHGQTLNPWDPAITCGGSSGGAGAAVALGIGTIAHGNDIGGSLRWPGFCNGVATIKPTQGRIPAFNPSATAERPLMAQFMSAQGPLARSIADVRLALEAMSAPDPRDPWYVPAPLIGPPAPRRAAVARIPADMPADPAMTAALTRAAAHLSDAGYAVEEVDVPDLDATWQLWADLILTELAVLQKAQMWEVGSDRFKTALTGFLKLGTILDQEGYMRAIARRSAVIRKWLAFLETYPVLLTPLSVRPVPGRDADLEGDARVRELFHGELRFMGAMNLLGLPAAVVPTGLVSGAPAGVQIVASRYREDLCLDAAAAIEAREGTLSAQLWAR